MNRLYIAHRGNTKGPNPSLENSPAYIQKALDEGFHVEIDVWVKDGKVYLGHDEPEYEVDLNYLKNPKFFCHAKNFEALELMYLNSEDIHFFSHDKDSHVLTSKGYIWIYPGQPTSKNTIIVMPETVEMTESQLCNCKGICSDYVYYLKKRLESA